MYIEYKANNHRAMIDAYIDVTDNNEYMLFWTCEYGAGEHIEEEKEQVFNNLEDCADYLNKMYDKYSDRYRVPENILH